MDRIDVVKKNLINRKVHKEGAKHAKEKDINLFR